MYTEELLSSGVIIMVGLINFRYDKILSVNEPLVVYCFGDTHYGNRGFDADTLKRHIEMCRKEDAYWVHLGDWVEAISPKDHRYDIRLTGSNPILEQYEEIIEMFEPIKEKGIAILSGNHDEKLARDYGDFIKMISKRLDIPYLGYAGFIYMRLKPTESMKYYTRSMFLHHGHGGGRKTGSRMNNLQDFGNKYDADIYGIGHNHAYLSHIDTLLGVRPNKRNGVKFHRRHRYFFSIPSYFRSYESSDVSNYAEKAAYQPQPIGCVRLEIRLLLKDENWELDVKIQPILGD